MFIRILTYIFCLFILISIPIKIEAQDFLDQRFDRQRVLRPRGSHPCTKRDSVVLPKIYSVLFDFNDDTLALTGIDTLPPDYYENLNVSQIADKNGILAARYTGHHLSDRYGNTINLDDFFPHDYGLRVFNIDNSMILPFPGKEDHFVLLFLSNLQFDETVFIRLPHAFSVVYFHVNKDGTIELDAFDTDLKDDPYLNDGGISACRHANGRDWWILAPIRRSSKVNCFLLDNNAIKFSHTIDTGIRLIDPSTTIRFSPNGKYYLIGESESFDPPIMNLRKVHQQMFSFDRCTGTLFDAFEYYLPSEDTNCVTTPLVDLNERFIYVATCNAIWQGDLWADDLPASFIKVCQADFTIPDVSFYHVIGNGFQGADGKMYFFDNNNTYGMTVINHPERQGLACDARYAGIVKPGCTSAAAGNMPYYGLGPLDGSPCDTLGLDGPMLTHLQKQHTTTPLTISPNPTGGTCTVQLPSQGGTLRIIDLSGKLIQQQPVSDFQMTATLDLPQGIFMVSYLSRDGLIRSVGKVMVR